MVGIFDGTRFEFEGSDPNLRGGIQILKINNYSSCSFLPEGLETWFMGHTFVTLYII